MEVVTYKGTGNVSWTPYTLFCMFRNNLVEQKVLFCFCQIRNLVYNSSNAEVRILNLRQKRLKECCCGCRKNSVGKDAVWVLTDFILGLLFSKAVVEQERCKRIPFSFFSSVYSRNNSLTLILGTLSYFFIFAFYWGVTLPTSFWKKFIWKARFFFSCCVLSWWLVSSSSTDY